MPEGGLNIRLRDTILGQEARLHDYKRDAMLAFVRANKLNRYITSGGRKPEDRHHHGRQELSRRAPGARRARHRRGASATTSACASTRSRCPWPLSQRELKEFARGPRPHHRGRGEALADRGAGARGALRHRQPAGLHRQEGRAGQLAVPGQGRARSQRHRDLHRRALLQRVGPNEELAGARRAARRRRSASLAETAGRRDRARPISAPAARTTPRPWCRRACAPMPASAAITWRSGWTARRSASPRWAARAPTGSARRRSPSAPHVFQNLGDGTYNHSGYLAIRAAIASGVNITYKILFNDAVAMTGGQTQRRRPHRAADRAPGRGRGRQARRRRHRRAEEISAGTRTGRRASPSITATISTRCRASSPTIPGCTVLIYDQTCAAEKRRRRKRGTFPDPDKRVIINELVCEGCGDCGVKSNCVSVQPLETEFGRKRTIDQSSCNKDFSCVKGFCPSFVTVHGAKLKKRHRRRPPSTTCRRCRSRRLPRDRARPTTSSSPASAAPASSPSAASSAWRRISKARASA